MKLWERATGRWEAILCGLGHEDALTRKHAPCPSCGGVDRFRYIGDDDGGFFCGDLRGSGVQLIQHLRGTSFRETADLIDSIIGKNENMERPDDSAYKGTMSLVARSVQVPKSSYLASRGLEVAPGIRFARDVPYYEEGKDTIMLDAMIAPITLNGETLSAQATYLRSGKKADVPVPRKTLPGRPIAGGACELYPAAECMGVAEGVETAIAAKMLFNTPTWATLSTSGMKSWQWPAVAKDIWIFADKDANYAGHAAAYALAHRIVKAGLTATVLFPDIVGDFNDVLKASLLERAKATP